LNYCITLLNNDEIERSREHFATFEKLFADLDEDTKNSDPEVAEQQAALKAHFAK
jgi:hypothetical protein